MRLDCRVIYTNALSGTATMKKREQGSSYAVVLIFVASLTVLIGSLALTSGNYAKMSSNVADGTRAFYIAQAGLNEGIWWAGARRRSPDLWGLPSAKGKGEFPFPITRSFAGGAYVVTVSAPGPGGAVDIAAKGTFRDAERTIGVTAQSQAFAIFSKNALTLGRTPQTPLEAAADGDLVFVDRGVVWGMKHHLEQIRWGVDAISGRTLEDRNILDDYAPIMGAAIQTRPVDPEGYVEVLLGVLSNVHWNYVGAKRHGKALVLNPDTGFSFHDIVGDLFKTKRGRDKKELYAAYREQVESYVAELPNESARQVLLGIVSHYPYGEGKHRKFKWKCPHALKIHGRHTILDTVGRFLGTRRSKHESHTSYAARLSQIIQKYDYSSTDKSLREENDEFWELIDLVGLCEQASADTRRAWIEQWIEQYPFTYYDQRQKSEKPPNLLDEYGAMLHVRRNWDKESDDEYRARLKNALDSAQIQVVGDIHSNQAIRTCSRTDQLDQDATIDLDGRATQVAEGDSPIALESVDFQTIKDRAEAEAKADKKQHVWTVDELNRHINKYSTVTLTGVHYVYLPGDAARAFDERLGIPKPSELSLMKVGGELIVEGCLAIDVPGHPSAPVPGVYLEDSQYKQLPAVRLYCDVSLTPGPVKAGSQSLSGPDAEGLPVLASSGIAVKFGPSFHEQARPAKALLHLLKRFHRLARSHVPSPNALDRVGAAVGVSRDADEDNHDYYKRLREGVHDKFDSANDVLADILNSDWSEVFEPFSSRDELVEHIGKWMHGKKRDPYETFAKFVERLVGKAKKAPKGQADVRLSLRGTIHCNGLISICSRPIIPRIFKPRKHWKHKKTYNTEGDVTAFGVIIGGGVYIERSSMQPRYYFRTYGTSAGLQVVDWRLE